MQGKSLAAQRAAGPAPTASRVRAGPGASLASPLPLEGCSETKSGVPAFQCYGCLRADKIVRKESDSMVKGKHQQLLDTEGWLCPYPDAAPFSKRGFWRVHLTQLVSWVQFEDMEEDDACVRKREREVQRGGSGGNL